MTEIDPLIKNLEEVITVEELLDLINKKERLNHYIGYEISGLLHLGSAFMSAMVIKYLQKLNVNCRIFLADWHSWINEKLGGDLEIIKNIGVKYYEEAFKACFKILEIKFEDIEFITGSQLYHCNDSYWLCFVEVAQNVTLSRIKRSLDILGRKAGESINFAKLIYPPMQVADIFALKANIVHAGIDQRKAHVIARQVAEKIKFLPLKDKKGNKIKPVILHHHLLLGLNKPPKYPLAKEELKNYLTELKMSKSKPDSAIFIHDSADEVKNKILKAFCPPKDISFNPLIDWVSHLLLPIFGEVKIKTSQGEKLFKENDELLKNYQEGLIHPLDLKESVYDYINRLIEPVRKHFESGLAKNILIEFKNYLKNKAT